MIYLNNCSIRLGTASGSYRKAALFTRISEKNLRDYYDHWKPYKQNRLKKIPFENYPDHWHWDWNAKHSNFTGQQSTQGFAITCRNMTQGMMFVKAPYFSKLPGAENHPLVYIEYLESAPWNIKEFTDSGIERYRDIGTYFLCAAIWLSKRKGYGGCIGLHSLIQTESFYNKFKFVDLGNDENYSNLRYYEMTAEQASNLLNGRDLFPEQPYLMLNFAKKPLVPLKSRTA